ncbi:hypothetical protein PbB2_02945 [Candidatus Phycosocius bacilliformis]|uniref:Uncharacterized protein n=1 Tax=Candidatus Phycosocius bacilliformis TaxID=1445552 RepID=A0A2P2EDW2_9PROT|nr:hypothetical protein [Candidatus Phycosocius bacilliformis]GBF59253.1 hypothetical protein PbB2_02945 [Candidatus Phycosocius bacilliformis]
MTWEFLNPQAFWGLVGVVVGSILTTAKDVFLDRTKQKRDRQYAAVRLVVILELYAEACHDTASDGGEMVSNDAGWEERETMVSKPVLDSFPDDIEWKALKSDLTYRVLRFPVLIAENERAISYAFDEIAGPPDYDEGFDERQKRYAQLGLEALKLAKELRAEVNLPEQAADGLSRELQSIKNRIEQN